MIKLSSSLPAQPTEFIGRSHELAALRELAQQPSCRLLTLVGPGGIGKTRLTLELAHAMESDFSDGAIFVPLQQVTSEDGLVPAIADALRHPLRGAGDMLGQVVDRLRAQQVLLALDNFEHLAAAASVVSELLAGAPEVKIVVSSREPLSLREEFTYHVEGLRFPDSPGDPVFAEYDAVRLFSLRLAQVMPGFDSEKEADSVYRICKLVQGMPLALELAAAWGRTVTCEEIAREIERNLDFLQTTLRNVPERHRSMRAVFDESWRILPDAERLVLERLSIFPGSFSRQAAESIAGATLPILSGLTDKSLLRQTSPGRFQLHEMVRQYAFERLSANPSEVETIRHQHAVFFASTLAELYSKALGGQQLELCSAIEADLENVRAAWQWGIDNRSSAVIGDAVGAFCMFGQYKSRYLESAEACQRADTALVDATNGEDRLVLAKVLVELGWFDIRLGRLEQAREVLTRCNQIYDDLGRDPVIGWATDPLSGLAILATVEGDYDRAEELSQLARLRSDRTGDPWSRELAFYALTRSALLHGRNDDAKRYAEETLRVSQEAQDHWFKAYCLLELGNVALARSDLDAANGYFQGCFEARKEFADPEGMAVALTQLGEIALRQSRFDDALEIFDQSMSHYRDINDAGGQASAFAGAAKASAALGYYETAKRYFGEAISLAVAIHFVPLVLDILAGIGEMLALQGQPQDATNIFATVSRHPGIDYETRTWLERSIERFDISIDQKKVGNEDARQAAEAALAAPLDQAFSLLSDHAAAHAAEVQPARARDRSPFDLTDRELEVLRLIAQGKSNRQIADTLVISANTAANHVKNILSKTNSANRAEATSYASTQGLL